MRRTVAALAALGLVALALTACSSAKAPSCERRLTNTSISSLATVSGPVGTAPTVALSSPVHPSPGSVADIVTGSGTQIVSPGQLVSLGISLYAADSGALVARDGYDAGTKPMLLSDAGQIIPGLPDALMCASEGSRVLIGLTPSELGSMLAKRVGLSETQSAIAVVDVRKVYLARADGADQFNDAQGLPTVVLAPSGQPGVVIPDAAPPRSLVVQTLKKGDGAAVSEDSTPRLAYSVFTWADKKEVDSSWGKTPLAFSLPQIIPGLAQALKGATVGSQLLVVVPPALGYGDTGSGPIPPQATLVFVLDILGIDPAS